MRRELSGDQLVQCALLCSAVYNESDEWLSYVSSADKLIYIAVKGTEDIGDWKTNLSFLFKHEDTHDGFKSGVIIDLYMARILFLASPRMLMVMFTLILLYTLVTLRKGLPIWLATIR